MVIAIALLVVAISGAFTAYYSSKRMDKLQEQIDILTMELNNINQRSIVFYNELKDAHINLDKQIKSQYSHFTSRIDKTRNDVLQNTRQY